MQLQVYLKIPVKRRFSWSVPTLDASDGSDLILLDGLERHNLGNPTESAVSVICLLDLYTLKRGLGKWTTDVK